MGGSIIMEHLLISKNDNSITGNLIPKLEYELSFDEINFINAELNTNLSRIIKEPIIDISYNLIEDSYGIDEIAHHYMSLGDKFKDIGNMFFGFSHYVWSHNAILFRRLAYLNDDVAPRCMLYSIPDDKVIEFSTNVGIDSTAKFALFTITDDSKKILGEIDEFAIDLETFKRYTMEEADYMSLGTAQKKLVDNGINLFYDIYLGNNRKMRVLVNKDEIQYL